MRINTLLIFAVAIVCFSFFVNADIIEPGTHYVSKCVKITNLQDYPDYIFLDYATLGNDEEIRFVKIVSQDDCLEKGYKFNQYSLKAIKSDSISLESLNQKISSHDYSGIDLSNAISANVELDPYGGYIGDLDPKSGENVYYSINNITSEAIFLTKVKQETIYNNGNPTKVEYFDGNTNTDEPINPIPDPYIPKKQPTFIDAIICFFASFFGSSC